jgi:hypothetical protein
LKSERTRASCSSNIGRRYPPNRAGAELPLSCLAAEPHTTPQSDLTIPSNRNPL